MDLDRATFSPEARQVGATLYKAVHRVQREESIEWTVMRDALYLTLVKASGRLETRGELTQQRARAAFNRRGAEDFIIGVPRRYTHPLSRQQPPSHSIYR